MLKDFYSKIAEVFSNTGGQPVKRPPVDPFEHTQKIKPKPVPAVSAPQEPEKKVYEQEHFEGHEAECDFCLTESLENLNSEKFKEYIVFAEILGKPKSKRRM